ncbi:Ca(2+)-dependent cysteine protease [Entomophthora muscae]|uniref:Ca(2+)-dependent cysteine protease n=1 Tax=Entomophthora muscae TaxID=34485 RepID=A0ACC2T8G9_9FUNG|nr:Ca(2+)-dependent cysteine protease [Entomophthora muscae]
MGQSLGKEKKACAKHAAKKAQTAPVKRSIDSTFVKKFEASELSGNKRALIIGINYFDYNNTLDSCVNDAKNMKKALIEHYSFKDDQILLLTDDETSESPTRKRILDALGWLLDGAQRNDSLVFYFSGHGLQEPDPTGIERDGLNEVICPVDYKTAGTIVDNVLHDLVVNRLPEACRLTVIIDCCHSGTMLDLPYEFKNLDSLVPSPNTNIQELIPLDVILLSGCQDSQTSADLGTKEVGDTSAFTFSLLDNLKSNPHSITYKYLLASIKKDLSFLPIDQVPMISAGFPLDPETRFNI